MVSPRLSSVHPSPTRSVAARTTCGSGTRPSHGSPKHIDRYPRTRRPRSRAPATTGANISSASAIVRFRLRRAKVSVALAKIAISVTPASSARSSPRALGTSTG